ncbi:glycosyltransferase family 4 protein [Candidatus Parcubacteria bacterium]|nr:glycosyltransferase family 4 protein [Candidatus Parcubacteria bacterium]
MQQNILIVTQKVDINDDILGFFHGWILEFAKNYEKVTVICLEKGDYDLPVNVKVLSLGKEKLKTKNSKLKTYRSFLYIKNFFKYIWQERKNYDKVFVHMNPEYVVLGGLFWKIWKKKIALWYTHKNVDLKLKIAEKLVNIIFTASKESFRLESKKLRIVGHGIDIDKFIPDRNYLKKDNFFEIVTIGRISTTKNQFLMIEAINLLIEQDIKNFIFNIVGAPITDVDKKYYEELKEYIEENKLENFVKFIGSVSHAEILPYYQKSDIFVNLSDTGSIDKVVLEAMSCGVYVLTSNDAFKSILPNEFLLEKNLEILASKIKNFIKQGREEKSMIIKKLRDIVVENNSLPELIKKIKNNF